MDKIRNKMSSKERIIAAIKHEPTDHLPLSFEGVGHARVEFLNRRYSDPFERANFYLDIDTDVAIMFSPPIYSNTGFDTKEWVEHPAGEIYPVLVKEYITPKGSLRQVVRKHEYSFDSVSLFSDHHIPSSRSIQYLVEKEEDLEKLEYILRPPNNDELRSYRQRVEKSRKFCDDKGILLTGYSQGIGDPVLWMSGIEIAVMSSVMNPDFLKQYVEIVSRWNKAILEIQIDAGIDLIVRRGWYESTDFWAPDLFREFLFEPLKQEIEIAHQAGVYFTYVMNSKAKPMLDIFSDLGFDIYSNIDPMTAGIDLADIKREIGKEITLFGGVNNFLVMETGTKDEVRKAVAEAIEKLSPDGGYILGLGDDLDCMSAYPETAERNFFEMVKVWKEMR
jgi:uroporphyrinogen-III decarboxylase